MNEQIASSKILSEQNNQSPEPQNIEEQNTDVGLLKDQTLSVQVDNNICNIQDNCSNIIAEQPQNNELKTAEDNKNHIDANDIPIEQKLTDQSNKLQVEDSQYVKVSQTNSYSQLSDHVQPIRKSQEVTSSQAPLCIKNSSQCSISLSPTTSPKKPTDIVGEQAPSPQSVKINLIPAQTNALKKEPSVSGTQLVFVKNNMPDKPQRTGYFQTRVLNISPKKEQDPFSIQNLMKQQVPNIQNIELLPGEQVMINEDACLITQKRKDDVKIVFTNYQLSYASKQIKRVSIPLGYIGKLQRTVETRPVVYSTIDVTLKMGSMLKFKPTSSKEISINIFKVMGKFIYCDVSDVFAFKHARSKKSANISIDSKEQIIQNDWENYHWMKQYKRMGIPFDEDSPFRAVNNVDGRACVSYPEYFIIPAKVSDELMKKSMKTRSRDRVPALSYAMHLLKQSKFVCLWRSSQSKFNPNTPRNLADQDYIKYLGNLTKDKTSVSKGKDIVIFDMKQKANSVSIITNSKSAAFPIEYYRNADIVSIEYESMAALRDSYNKLVAASCSTEPNKWLSLVEQSRWYQYVFALLRDAFLVSEYMQNAQNVLLQCCQGTDRTPQVAALVQIILDPYYRTVEGFSALVEKEFVSFGHPFGIRLGLKKEKQTDERAPVFIQFLDAVSQLIKQYPLSFEYTSKYLARIGFQLYTNRYGNFLCSSQREQFENKIFQETLSIWGELLEQNNFLYINPYYVLASETDTYELRPCVSIKAFQFFREHFLKLISQLKDDYQTNENAQQNQDYSDLLHKQMRLNIDSLKKTIQLEQIEINRLRNELMELQQQQMEE